MALQMKRNSKYIDTVWNVATFVCLQLVALRDIIYIYAHANA